MKFLGGLITALVVGSASSAHAWPWDNYSTHKDQGYGKTAAELADLYLPTGGSNHPAIIMIHGGAWVGGDKKERDYYAKMFADAGIAVVNINYRLLNMQTGANPWPAQLQDVQLAVRWMRANSQKLGIDPNRICAWGDSAGGHLSLLLGTMTKTKPGDRSAMYADQSSTVNCVIDLFGPTDLTAESAAPLNGVLKPLFGGKTAAQAREAYEEASPVNHVTSKTVPILIVQGLTDNIVLPAQSAALEKALSQKGVNHQMITFNGGHWYDKIQPKRKQAEVEAQIFGWVKAVLKP